MKNAEREISRLTDAEVREVFNYNDAPVFEPLIDFQLRFGGYIFYAGLAPINFSLIKGDGGYPEPSKTAIIEFEESKSSCPRYFFDCASTLYQMQFFLDENGVYYEDYEPKASSFAKKVEHLALWKEMNNRKDMELLFRDEMLKTNDLEKELRLELLPEASDQYTLWYSNEHIYMQQWQDMTTLFVSSSYPDKAKLLTL
ncbi:MAG: hypothetical protein JNM88_21495 [Chitinophagaceae bacterium]|nr:hypothetical protein [Chitinophagaceae bacterium]